MIDNPIFYGQLQIDRDLYEMFFKDKKNGFFVECGAFDGVLESSCKFFEENLNWTGLNIEPVPRIFESLINNRPNCINENVALSNKTGVSIFTQAISPQHGYFGNGSLQHMPQHKEELQRSNCTFETFQVPTVRFIDLCKKHNIKSIDLFVLDVEGHELEALDGIMCLPQETLPNIFCIENTWVGPDNVLNLLKDNYDFVYQQKWNAFFKKK